MKNFEASLFIELVNFEIKLFTDKNKFTHYELTKDNCAGACGVDWENHIIYIFVNIGISEDNKRDPLEILVHEASHAANKIMVHLGSSCSEFRSLLCELIYRKLKKYFEVNKMKKSNSRKKALERANKMDEAKGGMKKRGKKGQKETRRSKKKY